MLKRIWIHVILQPGYGQTILEQPLSDVRLGTSVNLHKVIALHLIQVDTYPTHDLGGSGGLMSYRTSPFGKHYR